MEIPVKMEIPVGRLIGPTNIGKLERRRNITGLLKVGVGLAVVAGCAAITRAQGPGNLEGTPAVIVEGRLEVVFRDDFATHTGTTEYRLRRQDQVLKIAFPNASSRQALISGDLVQLRGHEVSGYFAVDAGLGAVHRLAAAASSTAVTGSIALAIIMVNFTDNLDSPSDYRQRYQTIIPQEDSFYRELSYGALTVTGQVFGWYTLPIATSCDLDAINNAFERYRQAAGAPDLSAFNHRVYVLPQSACGNMGVTTIIIGPNTTIGLNAYVTPPDWGTLAHEMGHLLGLAHANSWWCGGIAYDPNEACVWWEYGDPYDVMGSVNAFHFNAVFKEYLGWLTPKAITASGTYDLLPLELPPGSGASALKIASNAAGGQFWYYVEYRRPLGADGADPNNRSPDFNGVLIHVGHNPAFVLNVEPNEPPNPNMERVVNPILHLNDSFVDPATGIRMTTVAVGPDKARVQIDVPSPALSGPDVQLISPAAASQIGDTSHPITLTAEASAPSGVVAKTEFFMRVPPQDGQSVDNDFLLGTALAPPYTMNWQNFPSGNLRLLARATTDSGLMGDSPIVPVHVNSPPQIRILSPSAFANVTGGVQVLADATDSDGSVTHVEFFDGNASLGTAPAAPFSIVLPALAAGLHTLTAVATDNGGAQSRSAPVPIYAYSVDRIASPATFSPAVVTGTATLTVLGASLSGESHLTYLWENVGPSAGNVVFALNNSNQAKSTSAAFSAPGEYTLRVTARDTDGSAAMNWLAVNVLPAGPVYDIRGKATGKCLDVNGKNPQQGALLVQEPCNQSTTQGFWLNRMALGFEITAAGGYCVDVYYAGTADGTKLEIVGCNPSDPNHHYTLDASGDGYFRLINVSTGKCIDMPPATDGTVILQRTCDGSSTESFSFVVAPQPARLTIAIAVIADAFRGVPYRQVLSAQGGQPPYNWSIIGGVLPPGLSLSPDGIVSGVPLYANSPKYLWMCATTIDVTVRVTDAKSATADKDLSGACMATLAAPPFTPPILPVVGLTPLSATIPATGGSGSITLTVSPANSPWVASSDQPWLMLPFDGSGVGNGIIGYVVAANTGAARTGSITVAGQKLIINQAAGVAVANVSGVVNAASFGPPIAPGGFISIYGQNLADITTDWGSAITKGKLPTSLGGVQVLINGKNAFISYVQPTQVNALAPPDVATGPAEVDVITNHGTVSATVNVASIAPALFTYAIQGVVYAAAQFASDYAYVAPSGALSGVSSRPAKPGDNILLYATGLGPTNPASPAGQVLTTAYPVADLSQVKVLIGGQAALVQFVGMTYAGLFQVNVQVPSGVPNGDQPVVLQIGGQPSQVHVNLTVGAPVLVGWWTFDDVSGNAVPDRSDLGNNGTIVGGASVVPGKIGQALSLDGVDQYVSIHNSASLDVASYSVAAWVQPSALVAGKEYRIVSNGGYGNVNGAVDFLIDSGGRLAILNQNSSGQDTYRSSVLPFRVGAWVHVAATFDAVSGNPHLYVNGTELPGTFDSGARLRVPNQNPAYGFNIGATGNPTPGTFFAGSIDDVRFYNRALSAAEIQQVSSGM